MPRSFIRVFFCLLFTFPAAVFAQSSYLTDSTYLAYQKIKPDSVKYYNTMVYACSKIRSKSPIGTPIANALIKSLIQIKDYHTLGRAYINIGYSYLAIGEYAKAYPNYMLALDVYKNINEPVRLARIYTDLVWIQTQFKEYEQGEISAQRAIKICKDHNLLAAEGAAYGNYGILNDSQEKFEKAIECYKIAVALNEKYGLPYTYISSLTNLAVSQRRYKKYDEALATLLKAKPLADKLAYPELKQSVNQNLAELTYEMKDYDKAEVYILAALANSKGNYDAVLQRGLYTNMRDIYTKRGNYKSALLYADSVEQLDKRVFTKEQLTTTLDLQTKYDTKLKDEQIQKQNALNIQQRQQLLLNQNQLALTLEQKKNEQLGFTKKQAELENQKALQQSVMQKDRLQSRLDKQTSNQQIFQQKEKLKTDSRLQLFLGLLALMAIFISGLIFYNQRKTKRLNQLVTEQKKDLESLNGVKDRIFSIIGHDMRAPVNTLISFNHLLEDDNLSSEKIKLYAKEIKKTLNHTSVLMENLLNWSRSQMQGYKPNIQTHLLKAISNDVINTVGAQALQKAISIKNNIAIDAVIFADADMTELIMRNIVSNAIKFTPNHGSIELSAIQTEKDTTFYIKDSGNGMAKEQVLTFNNEAQSYNTTSQAGTNKEKGTGLGLMLCKTFTNLMNGKIRVDSEPGKGSTFYVTLPKLAY